jgi:hypothetical protein
VGVSNHQPDLDIVISVRIFDNFKRMSMSNHMEVREVIIFEGGGGGGGGEPTIIFDGIQKISKIYGIICSCDKGLENIAITIRFLSRTGGVL